MKEYLVGNVNQMVDADAKTCSRIAPEYIVDENELLFFCPRSSGSSEDRTEMIRLVVPELMQQEFLRHYHTSLKGGYQEIRSTYQRIRSNFHWRWLYRSVHQCVGECVDCTTGKGVPSIPGGSPGNLQAAYSFQMITMDYISSLPSSFKGNT